MPRNRQRKALSVPYLIQSYFLPARFRSEDDNLVRVQWAPNGHLVAAIFDHRLHLWDTKTLRHRSVYHSSKRLLSLAWSPNSDSLVVGNIVGTIIKLTVSPWGEFVAPTWRLQLPIANPVNSLNWLSEGDRLLCLSRFTIFEIRVSSDVLPWSSPTAYAGLGSKLQQAAVSLVGSPNGGVLAIGTKEGRILLGHRDDDLRSIRNIISLRGHTDVVRDLTWSHAGTMLISCSSDRTIRVWNPNLHNPTRVLEGHTSAIVSVAISHDDATLASSDAKGQIRLWATDTWQMLTRISHSSSRPGFANLAFHPSERWLAVTGPDLRSIQVWNVDLLPELDAAEQTDYYTNAKVVLLGDSGVGKSGLGLVLSGQPYTATESTHSRKVWTLDETQVPLDANRSETRETLLWDMAGQPGYRLIHQLHLNEISASLVLFDASHDVDPFKGVRYWSRALDQAQLLQGSISKAPKYLIAARMDLGGIGATTQRAEALIGELGFSGYFQTSAKERWGITELKEAINAAIDWSILPRVVSTKLFRRIKGFLLSEIKREGRLLTRIDDLYSSYLLVLDELPNPEETRDQFETCLSRLASAGLIQQFSFGDLILLRPEMLDSYAAALINTAREDPDQLGSIAEEDALAGKLLLAEDQRIRDKSSERLLLLATIEDLLRRELLLREHTSDGVQLVFPAQLMREDPDLVDPVKEDIIFTCEGPISNIYAALVVRLSRSGLFKKDSLWKNAATFRAMIGGQCGVLLRNISEGAAEFALFFSSDTTEETRFVFEEYIRSHLERRALAGTLQRTRVYSCPNCSTAITTLQASRRRDLGFENIRCNVCDTIFTLRDREERLTLTSKEEITAMDDSANTKLNLETAEAILQGKIASGDFDVFLAHNSQDKSTVEMIGEELKKRGLLPWLDKWNIPPGRLFQEEIERILPSIKSVAIFVGESGIGPWENMEMRAALTQFVRRRVPVIPVLLPDAPRKPTLPLFLQEFNWVEFENDINDTVALDYLEWGITGKHR